MNTKRSTDGPGADQYLSSAPVTLIGRFEQQQNFPGREILRRLLTDPIMRRPWTVLSQSIKSPRQWEGLWKEIVWALHRARLDSSQYPPNERARTKRKLELLAIEKKANDLAEAVAGGRLDVRAYELFPNDVMEILGARNWPTLGSLQRATTAGELLKEWPTAPELLRELATLAAQMADEVMTRKNPVERGSRDRKARYFASVLCTYFRTTYSTPFYGTVANIATVALGYPVTKKLVENTAKRPDSVV